MATRANLRSDISQRLGDVALAIFTASELNTYIDAAIKSLYPTHFQQHVGITTASDGPLQTKPVGARDLYFIGLQKQGSTRVRLIRQWREGLLDAYVPKTGIANDTLVWAWTSGFNSPTNDTDTLDINPETEEIVKLRVQISALERIVSSRVESAKYFALTVREGVTEADLTATLDALHASLQQRLQQAVKRPERVG